MSLLSIERVSLAYDGGPEILAGVSLDLRAGEVVAVIGRSGSGKTSLLNLAAGFIRPTRGAVRVDGREVTGPGAERAVVFQDDALFPWLSARDNVAFPLRLKGMPAIERRPRADALMATVGLESAGDKAVWTLSGGMRQRVGIARALAAEPRFLLMDEPFGALDTLTRERMQDVLLDLGRNTDAGILVITHSIEEALVLADRVVVLAPSPGRIVEDVFAPFRRRRFAGEATVKLRTSQEFVAERERLAGLIGADHAEVAA